jgi:hypothetical protein
VASGTKWQVRCDCGKRKVVFTVALRSGQTTSCGCLVREGNAKTHGEAYKTAEYRAWQLMKRRAEHSKGRVKVCARWQNSYENFLADVGRKSQPTDSLDRKDGTGHYEPSNCRWATKTQQAQNLRSNRLLTFKGQTKCLTQWAREYGVNAKTLAQRLDHGWTVNKALGTQPLHETWKRPAGAEGKTPEYRTWIQIRRRCQNPESMNFAEYGARGVQVCVRWESFGVFLADVGRRPSPKHSLDRVDPNGNYEPENCRWATSKIQQRNRRNNRLLAFKGEIRCVAEWAERLGFSYTVIRARLQRGWDVDRAMTEQVRTP